MESVRSKREPPAGKEYHKQCQTTAVIIYISFPDESFFSTDRLLERMSTKVTLAPELFRFHRSVVMHEIGRRHFQNKTSWERFII